MSAEEYQCPECGADLDEESIRHQLAGLLAEQGATSAAVEIRVSCPDCGAELVAVPWVSVDVDNAVFEPADE